MTEMVERVAIAIACEELGLVPSDWEKCWPTAKNKYREVARAAIAAMREPTAAMIKADGNGELDSWIKEDWQDMIDEALKR